MKTLLKAFSFVVIALFVSCDKNEESLPGNTGSLLYQVYYGSKLYYEYNYTPDSLINEIKSIHSYVKYNYEGSKLISSDNYYDEGMFSSNYELAQAAMNRTEWVSPKNTPKSRSNTYYYDRAGRLNKISNDLSTVVFTYSGVRISRQSFYGNDGRITGFKEYSYDNNGNITTENHYYVSDTGTETLVTTTEYEYDDKLNPYAMRNLTTPGVETNRNNIVSETYTLHDDAGAQMEKVTITKNTYEYNEKGYPVKINNMVELKYK